MPSRTDRIRGAFWGLLIGDALGVPYEFHPPEALPPLSAIEFDPPDAFARAHDEVPPGTWSDDGAQALALLASLIEQDGLDLDDLGQRLVAWKTSGYMAVDKKVFDIGIQTQEALKAIEIGVPPAAAGPRHELANGNGSLMRVLPLALWHVGSDADLVRDARAQSRVTHGHPRAQLCCALYCLWARNLLDGTGDWPEAVSTLGALLDPASPDTYELELILTYGKRGGTGYVVDCLHSARLALKHDTYEDVVKAAVAIGHDTDTTACVAGGLAGLRTGIEGIPSHWREALRGREIAEPLLARLLAREPESV
ncbi:MAG: ADP-ribosylglycohydrolase family protein [Bacteroidota bacterium]